MQYIIGQILGIGSTVCTIILPFFKKKWQILAANILVNLLISLNFILIGNIFGSITGIICGGGTTAMVGLATELGATDIHFGLLAAHVRHARTARCRGR